MSTSPKFTQFSFNAANIAPQQPMEAVPTAWYPMVISDIEVKPNTNGSGIRMPFEVTIIGDGPFKNRKAWDGFNIEHTNAQTQEIAQQQLSAICHATGVIQFNDVQELMQKPFEGKLGLDPARWVDANGKDVAVPAGHPAGTPPPGAVKFYEAKNVFKGARPLAGGEAGVTTTAAAPIPDWAKRQPTVAAPTAKAATAPAPIATPPPPTTPPFTPTATAPATSAGAKAPKGPKGPSKPQSVAKYFVFLGENDMPLKTDAEVREMIGQGMPLETLVSLADKDDGFIDDSWKAASEVFAASAASEVFAASAAPAAQTPAGAPVQPPWLRKK